MLMCTVRKNMDMQKLEIISQGHNFIFMQKNFFLSYNFDFIVMIIISVIVYKRLRNINNDIIGFYFRKDPVYTQI